MLDHACSGVCRAIAAADMLRARKRRVCALPNSGQRQAVNGRPRPASRAPRQRRVAPLNDQLLANAKALAAQQRTSLTRLIEEGLQLRLRAKSVDAVRTRTRLPVFKGCGGLVAGVEPRSNKALLEALGDDT